jgi:DNA-binding protein YbaB
MKGFPGGFGGGNMNNLLKQAQKLQKDIEDAKKNLEFILLDIKKYKEQDEALEAAKILNGKTQILQP